MTEGTTSADGAPPTLAQPTLAQPTLAETIIARAAGRERVRPGDVVIAKVDLAMIHDSGGPRRVKPILERFGVGVWDKRKVALVTDHYTPAFDAATKAIQTLTRAWAEEQGVAFYDEQGICHVVTPERGHLAPGMFAVGGDSHSPTGGAFGAYMFGIGATEMAGVLATGEIWIRTPETILIEWTGRLNDGVVAKDIMLRLCGALGMDGGRYQAVQYAGSAVEALSMQERMTLANMAAELGGQTGLIAPDATTADWLRAHGADPQRLTEDALAPLRFNREADVAERHVFDASALAPQIAAPHSPANSDAVDAFADVRPNMAYIGACTGAKYDDLAMAARILRSRKCASGVSLVVAPASVRDLERAKQDGVAQVFEEAGATFAPSACGICAGYGAHRLDADAVCLSSTARNFKGRMGDPNAQVYLGSPYSVAAAAVAGRIVDPRELLEGAA